MEINPGHARREVAHAGVLLSSGEEARLEGTADPTPEGDRGRPRRVSATHRPCPSAALLIHSTLDSAMDPTDRPPPSPPEGARNISSISKSRRHVEASISFYEPTFETCRPPLSASYSFFSSLSFAHQQ